MKQAIFSLSTEDGSSMKVEIEGSAMDIMNLIASAASEDPQIEMVLMMALMAIRDKRSGDVGEDELESLLSQLTPTAEA